MHQTSGNTPHASSVFREPIAVTGLGCWYPGARNPVQLWENVLARRLEFRRIPDARLSLSDYCDVTGASPDHTNARRAAVIDGFSFDWSGRRIPKSMHESTDIVHWLALEVAEQALHDAGYTRESVPGTGTGVIVGNTLTGDITRSNCMRLRWPFVRRALGAAVTARGLPVNVREALELTMEDHYKSVFPAVTEDSLAGGLANTIAGRICNYFDLHGGGYIVDGACSSSMLAVCTAARALTIGDLDIALAGGVDISIDPFELVGFARAGALTNDDMLVYDKRASGFIPGEGCGFVVLKRLKDARRDGDTVYAVLRGWGISSDGKGGIMTPTSEGQEMAIRRAYSDAGYSPGELDFVEGHGTGTRVGDQIELESIAAAMASDKPLVPRRTGVTSFKSIVGHTKAAAGIGAFIKAVIAVNRRVLPPTASCTRPNDVFENQARALYPILHGRVLDRSDTVRAGVSAMGFGGINSHVTVESGDAPSERLSSSIDEQALIASRQETELFVLTSSSVMELRDRIRELSNFVDRLSVGDLVDLATHLSQQTAPAAPIRSAIVAGTPDELAERLTSLDSLLTTYPPGESEVTFTPQREVWVSNGCTQTDVGFLFPGQGAQQLNMARTLYDRFEWARDIVGLADQIQTDEDRPTVSSVMFPEVDRAVDQADIEALRDGLARTEVAQPAICIASVLYARYLDSLGIRPVAVGGHSLGELTAFHVAGAFDVRTLLRLVSLRGQAMAASSGEGGAMAALQCSAEEAEALIADAPGYAIVANINSPKQVVVSGEEQCVLDIVSAAVIKGIQSRRLPVSNAFHSKLVASAADRLRAEAPVPPNPQSLDCALFSCTSGSKVRADVQLTDYFAKQVLNRVDFVSMIEALEPMCDMLIEVGPGRALSGLSEEILGGWSDATCLPVAGRPDADRDLNTVVARAFVHGIDICWEALYGGRLSRPFVPVDKRQFITNPCEQPFAPTATAEPLDLSTSKQGLESELAQITGVEAGLLTQYLERRSGFLRDVVLADLRSMSGESTSDQVAFPALDDSGSKLLADEPPRDGPGGNEEESAATGDKPLIVSDPKASSSDGLQELLVELVQRRTGFPVETITMDVRLLDDLNLDSIKAGEIIATAARQVGASGTIDPASLANATLSDVVTAVRNAMPGASAGDGPRSVGPAQSQDPTASQPSALPTDESDPQPDIPGWIRSFTVEFVETSLDADNRSTIKDRQYGVLHEPSDSALAVAIADQVKDLGATADLTPFDVEEEAASSWTHVVAILPFEGSVPEPFERVERMSDRIRCAVAHTRLSEQPIPTVGIAFVQRGGGRFGTDNAMNVEACCAASFARSLHLEAMDLEVRVVDLSPDMQASEAARSVAAELGGPEPFRSAGYDALGVRFEPRHCLRQPISDPPVDIAWSADDVILVTGGGRGITAECALALARRSGAKVALIGSSPAPGPIPTGGAAEIAATLTRFDALESCCEYFQCDITDGPAVVKLIHEITKSLGPITAILHGAGRNHPRLANTVSGAEAMAEVAPKVLGFLHLIDALGPHSLRLLVGLTSVIGVTGIPGNAWYAFSNEVLDLLLRGYQSDNPDAIVRSLSFSAWGEVGMGANPAVVDRLRRMGVGTIPTAEGVARFIHCIEHDPGSLQVVITGSLGGLDTWRPVVKDYPEGLRFIEKLVRFEPQVDLIARATLTLDRDSYLEHHMYRDSYLFPAVFGLEAMAQAVSRLLGAERLSIVRIEDVQLARPILVGEDGKVEIEIRAEAFETEESGERRVRVGVRSELTGFGIDHFAADLVCGQPSPGPKFSVATGEALTIDPKADLYGGLLFQGPLFQRWGQTFSLSQDRAVFEVDRRPSPERGKDGLAGSALGTLILGDPYCHDVLLQSVQVLMPQHVGLPLSIERIEFFRPGLLGEDAGGAKTPTPPIKSGVADEADVDTTWTVTAILKALGDQVGEQSIGEVVATDCTGHIVEKLVGYTVKILEIKRTNPTAEELAELEMFDQGVLLQTIDTDLPALGLHRPTITLRRMPELHGLSREQRRDLEMPVIAQAVQEHLRSSDGAPADLHVAWRATGRPTLSGDQVGDTDLSLSHDDDYCLCIVGTGPAGCDIAPVTSRSHVEWAALLGAHNERVLAELVERGDPLDRAGTRIWAAVEAVQKSIDTDTPVPLRIEQWRQNAVTLVIDAPGNDALVFTTPVPLWRRPERVVAFVASRDQIPAVAALKKQEFAQEEIVEFENFRLRGIMDGPQGQPVFEHRFVVTFKECSTRGRRVQFAHYLSWLGTIRENALLHLAPNMMAQLSGGEWGMSTNWTDVRVTGETMTGDVIQGRLWADSVDGSSVRLCCDFARVLSGERLERLAFCRQQTTWVRLHHRAEPSRESFPPFLAEAFEVMAPRDDRPARIPELPEGLGRFDAQRAKLREQGNGASRLLQTNEFDTCFDDANLVGNIYYSRYFTWQLRACDRFLHSVVPGIVMGTDDVQEWLPLRSRMDFMRDAFPFDRIRTEMRVRSVTESAAALSFVFYRILPGGSLEKLSVGEQDVVWVRRTANGSPVPAPFPEPLRRALEVEGEMANAEDAGVRGGTPDERQV